MAQLRADRLLKKKFNTLDFTGRWQDSMGTPQQGFKALIYGESGHGKTEMAVQFAAYMSQFGHVLYVSQEQGVSESLRQSFARNEINEKVMLLYDTTLTQVLEYLKGKPRFKTVILDSLDYLHMKKQTYVDITETLKKINIIIVAWGEGTRPRTRDAQGILFMTDIKIFVKNYVGRCSSRYEGGADYVVWEEGARQRNPQLSV